LNVVEGDHHRCHPKKIRPNAITKPVLVLTLNDTAVDMLVQSSPYYPEKPAVFGLDFGWTLDLLGCGPFLSVGLVEVDKSTLTMALSAESSHHASWEG
jgi:hypothetical protein